MKQKLFTLLFVMMTNIGTLFAEKVQIGDLYYYLYDDGTAAVTSKSGDYYGNYSGLTDVVIPESITYNDITYSVTGIVTQAFRNCRTLTSVTLPNSITFIWASVFEDCTNLKSINIPASVTTIGMAAGARSSIFEGCISLTSITVDEGNAIYDSRNNCNAIIETVKNELIDGCGQTIIPNSVTSIGYQAFIGRKNLNSIVIPNSVTSIGNSAFYGCSGLTSLTIPNSVTSIGSGAFDGCSNLLVIELPNSVTSIGAYAFSNCSGLTSVTIPNSVIYIGNYAFKNCIGLTSLNIPDNVTNIGDGAFYNCNRLTSINIPNGITSIGDYFFYGCSSLSSFTVPNSVTSIGEQAFYSCSSLISIIIPNSIKNIGSKAFYNCTKIKHIISNAVTPPQIYSSTFTNIPSEAVVYVPNDALFAYMSASNWKDIAVKPFFSIEQNNSSTTVILTLSNNIWELTNDYIISCGIEGGETFDGNTLEIVGLKPETEYTNTLVMTSNTGETETINVSFVTSALELITQESKAVSSNTALLFAKTNMSDAEVNCGFEWRRDNQPEGMASTKVYAPVANGTMAGRLKGLKDDVYYKYRAFYESSAGNKYYGDWQYIFTGDDAVEFDPVMYTYPASAVTETTATLKGYALAGSDEFTEQGFEYWVEVRIIPVNANNAPKRAYHSAVGEHMTVAASGISMKVTLTDLDEGSVYKYRTYAVVDGQKVYGEEQSFTTRGEYLYTVTFVDYDGSVLGTDKVHYGEAATAPNDPAREGYNFSGWDIDFSAVTDDITVTAVYSIATALPDTQLSESAHPRKLIKENQLLILRDGKTYTVHGLEVR